MFRANPFYRVEMGLGQLATLQKAGTGEKKTGAVMLTLSEAQRQLLVASKSVYVCPTLDNSLEDVAHLF